MLPENVLVQILSGSDSEEEAARHGGGRRGRRLRDDRGMDSHGRASDAGADSQPLGLASDAAEYRPDEGAFSLAADPWVIVVRDESEGEPDFLGSSRIADEVPRPMLLGRECIPQLCHRVLPLARRRSP